MTTASTIEEVKLARQKLGFKREKIRLALDERKLAEVESEGMGGDWEPNLSALSRRFGISRQTFSDWTKSPDSPTRDKNRGYRVKDWGVWLAKRRNLSVSEERERSARARSVLAQAEWREMLNAERKGQLMPTDEHKRAIRVIVGRFMDIIRAFPQRVSMRSTSAELRAAAEEVLAEAVHEVREMFNT